MDRQKLIEEARIRAREMGAIPPSSPANESNPWAEYDKAFTNIPTAPVTPKKGLIGRTVENVKEAVKNPIGALDKATGLSGNLIMKDEQGNLKLNKENAQAIVDTTSNYTGGASGVQKAKTTVKDIVTNRSTNAIKSKLLKIEEKISPATTKKEAQIAQKEGRFISGKEPSLLRGGKEDVILPSDKTIRASETILREIPNAPKLSESQLFGELSNKTKTIAQELKPEMEKIPVSDDTLLNANKKWNELKQKQITEVDATDEINVIKRQKRFEEFLGKIKNNDVQDLIQKARNGELTQEQFSQQVAERLQKAEKANLNNVWDARKAYDDSIPEAVKKATSLSDSKLLQLQQEWLQNREILNSMITDLENGLGDTAKTRFADMRDMYSAKEAILGKTKVTKGKPSKASQWVKENPVKATIIGTAIGGGVLKKGFDAVTGN